MVGIVVVSHSDTLAEGVVKLAREMGGADLTLEAAGGTEDAGVLGTDAERVRAAIERAMTVDGVLVLMDLGSALMSAEFAVELLTDPPGRVVLSEAPLVEGAVAAAAAASGGASLAEVAAEARGALAMKSSQLGVQDGGTPETRIDGLAASARSASLPRQTGRPRDHPEDAERSEAPDSEASIPVRNAVGLHARPAARFVETVRGFDAEVRVAKAGAGGGPVRATSLTNVVALGARFGDTLLVSASGRDAAGAIAALKALSDDGFGDGIAPGAPPPSSGLSPQAPANTTA
ncbi:MAG: PTS-dependent dihydroxyacetone kinase phosphotransferase subunit DhaM, partial [Solirubrobacterales bacterium]|nr:PTS-dependent dihydroxyacetone kinase phosphotransferase subunit DhaM [Solirubrobacterales bacterium]